jgi:hypothetical protein
MGPIQSVNVDLASGMLEERRVGWPLGGSFTYG